MKENTTITAGNHKDEAWLFFKSCNVLVLSVHGLNQRELGLVYFRHKTSQTTYLVIVIYFLVNLCFNAFMCTC